MTGEGSFCRERTHQLGSWQGEPSRRWAKGVLTEPGQRVQRGAVIWEVTEGVGQFAGADGSLTSISRSGAKARSVDNHYVRL